MDILVFASIIWIGKTKNRCDIWEENPAEKREDECNNDGGGVLKKEEQRKEESEVG